MKAITFVSTIVLSVMFAGMALADRQDYDASQGLITGGNGTSAQTDAAKNSMGIGSDAQNNDKSNTHANTNTNSNGNGPDTSNPSDDNSSEKPVLPVPYN
ncbi:MAG: hypothetical protein ACHQAX_05465 [Gammaproteobacteria bacterium]